MHMVVMPLDQPIERPPAHPFRLWTVTVQDPGLPAEPHADAIGSACCPAARILACTVVGKLVAASAGEGAPSVEDCHPPRATPRRTEEPDAASTQMARGMCDADRIVLVLPVTAAATMPIGQSFWGQSRETERQRRH